ncbi:MAG TPA: GNAT family N-acetyltransferase, partial [Clostridium sp.]|nr:GNAT family N-acetyltransferase [Clostridium sp.]
MIKQLDLKDKKVLEKVLDVQISSYKIEAEIIGFDEIPPLKDTINTLKQCNETFYGYFIDDILAGIISYKIEND